MEMCVCLIPILVVLLGMIFISGLGISNIRAFVKAKGNAELASRSVNAIGGSGENIHHWDYGEDEDEGDGYPFTADDQTVNFYQAGSEYGTETLMEMQLNMIQDSESLSEGDNSKYIFMPTSLVPYASDNFAQNLPDTMLAAAELVVGRADSNFNNVFTLNSNHMDDNEIQSLNLSFTHLFGIEIDDLDLRDMRANTVYYPALPTQSTTGSSSNEDQTWQNVTETEY